MLKEIELPNGLEVNKEYAFKGCVELTTVIFSEGLQSIETGAFQGCSSLEYVVIPSTVNYLGMHVFLMCVKLREIVIHDGLQHGLQKIDGNLFYVHFTWNCTYSDFGFGNI